LACRSRVQLTAPTFPLARVQLTASPSPLPVPHSPVRAASFPQLEPMDRAVLEKIPELQVLHRALKDAGVSDLVSSVLGGNPAHYLNLNGRWMYMGGAIKPVAEG
jgi:hypothetical protein